MSFINEYYRAYADLLERLNTVTDFNNLNSAFKHGNVGEDISISKAGVREFEIDWIEAMEASLPYIDKAIKEQRRFISQTDEVVPIEKSKKITNESVRHLAQHTNMIGRVEEDTVIPKSILNIQREESFDIYENRYLRTLILKSSNFIERCYKETLGNNNDLYTKLSMNRNVLVNKKLVKFDLDFELNIPENAEKFQINEDVSNLTSYQRVLRLRLIFSDFLNTPLMKNLNGLPEIRSPLNHTNLLTKDPNFRETVKLWQFLESYNKTGYTIISNKDNEVMKEAVENGIYNVMSLLQFVIRLNLDDNFNKNLQEAFIKENKQIEENRRRNNQKMIDEATAVIKEEYQHRIIEFQLENARLVKTHEEELLNQKNDYEGKLKNQEDIYNKNLKDKDEAHQKEVIDLNNQFEFKFSEQKASFENTLLEKERQFDSLIKINDVKHQNEITKLNTEYEETLNVQKNDYEARILDINKNYDTKINDLNSEHNNVLLNLNIEHSEEIERLNNDYTNNIDRLNKEHSDTLIKLNNEHEIALKDKQDRLDTYYKNIIDKNNDKFNKKQASDKKIIDANYIRINQLNETLIKKNDSIKTLSYDLKSSRRENKLLLKKIDRLRRRITRLENKLNQVQ